MRRCVISPDLSPGWDRRFIAVMGVTWTFHMVWTLWMIPRDQPDLKENGTFLSLVVIYLANLLVLVGLLCVAAESPLQNYAGVRDGMAAPRRDLGRHVPALGERDDR